MQDVVIIIPTLNPKEKLIELINELKEKNFKRIIVVNDGSNNESKKIFEAIKNDVIILEHKENEGKGKALKDAIEYILNKMDGFIGCITVDGDGQHRPNDIIKLANKLRENNQEGKNNLILGVRNLYGENVPFKSKFGNKFSSIFFKAQTGVDLKDTQTGLRAIPTALMPKTINIKGDRYDYEMNVLTRFAFDKIKFEMIDIETVYDENNKGSHFRAIKDSLLIYKQLVRFAIIAISSAIIDVGIFSILAHILKNKIPLYVFISTAIARISSGAYNFWANKKWSFESEENTKSQLYKYIILFVFQMCISSLLVTLFEKLPIDITVIKIIVDLFIFTVNYFVEKRFIFNK